MKLKYYLRGLGIGIVVTAILLSVSLHSKTKPMTDEEIKKRALELGMEEKYDSSVLADSVSQNELAYSDANENVTENQAKEEIKEEPKEEVKEEPKEEVKEEPKEEVKEETTEEVKEEPKEEVKEETKENNNTKNDENAEVEKESTNPKAEEALKKADEAVEATQKAADEAVEKANESVDKAKDSSKEIEKAADDIIKSADDLKEIKTDEDAKQDAKTDIKQETNADSKTDGKEYKITVAGGDGSLTVAKKLKEIGLIEDALVFDNFLCQNGYDRKICTGVHTFKASDSKDEIAKNLTRKTN